MPNFTFDLYPVLSSRISDLNLALFSYEYLPKAFSAEILDANDRSLNEQLAAPKMIAAADIRQQLSSESSRLERTHRISYPGLMCNSSESMGMNSRMILLTVLQHAGRFLIRFAV